MRATTERKLHTHTPSRRLMLRGHEGESSRRLHPTTRNTGAFRGTRRHGPARHARIFLPGQPVPETGIYEVIHHRAHRVSHEAVMHREDLFPVCDQCNTRVRFKLIRTAPYIFDDEDFVEEK